MYPFLSFGKGGRTRTYVVSRDGFGDHCRRRWATPLFGGRRGVRTLAPFHRPNALAVRPLHQLEYPTKYAHIGRVLIKISYELNLQK